MSINKINTLQPSYVSSCSFFHKNRTLIITSVALIAIALCTTGILSHVGVIKGVNEIGRWSLVGAGVLTFFVSVFMGLLERKFIPQSNVQSDTTWTVQNQQIVHEDKEHLVITTFNVGMLPSFVTGFQRIGNYVANFFSSSEKYQLDSAVKRIKKIAEKLNSLEIKNDIISFQELFCPLATESLCKDLREYNIVHSVGGGKPVNSGLAFASRHPIKEEGIRFHKFTNLGGEDAFSSKGLLRVLVLIKNKETIFYTVHLQAKFGPEYQKIRQEQMETVHEIISEDQKQNPDTPIFLCGDFNISDIDEHERTNDYSGLKHVFDQFHDLFLIDHGSDCKRTNTVTPPQADEPTGSFYDMKVGGNGKELHQVRYDYVLLHKNPGNKSLIHIDSHSEFQRWAYREDTECTPPFLSDHLPFTVRIPFEVV